MNYIDLFAGAGGLSEGFTKAGFNPIAHVESDKAACFTLMTRLAYTFVSSSFVKEIVSHNHSVEGLVPACVEEKLIKKYRG